MLWASSPGAAFQSWTVDPSTRRPLALRWSRGLPASLARSRARRSSMLRMASYNNLMTAVSEGKWPRVLMILRSWWFNDSIEFVV